MDLIFLTHCFLFQYHSQCIQHRNRRNFKCLEMSGATVCSAFFLQPLVESSAPKGNMVPFQTHRRMVFPLHSPCHHHFSTCSLPLWKTISHVTFPHVLTNNAVREIELIKYLLNNLKLNKSNQCNTIHNKDIYTVLSTNFSTCLYVGFELTTSWFTSCQYSCYATISVRY